MDLSYGRRRPADIAEKPRVASLPAAGREPRVSRMVIAVRGLAPVVIGGRPESQMHRAEPDVELKVRRIFRSLD